MFARKLALSAAAFALLGSAAFAADLTIPSTPDPVVEASGVTWDGLYAGVQAGGYFEEGYDVQGFVGGVVGANYTVADPIVIGGELQANYYFENGDFDAAWEVLALGKLGVVVTPSVLVYATGGFGYVKESDDDSYSEYALGAGIEFAVADQVSVRADVLAIGYPGDDAAFEAGRASVGLFYHF